MIYDWLYSLASVTVHHQLYSILLLLKSAMRTGVRSPSFELSNPRATFSALNLADVVNQYQRDRNGT